MVSRCICALSIFICVVITSFCSFSIHLEHNYFKNMSGRQCFWPFWISRQPNTTISEAKIVLFMGFFFTIIRNLFSGRWQNKAESAVTFVLIPLLVRSENPNTQKPWRRPNSRAFEELLIKTNSRPKAAQLISLTTFALKKLASSSTFSYQSKTSNYWHESFKCWQKKSKNSSILEVSHKYFLFFDWKYD